MTKRKLWQTVLKYFIPLLISVGLCYLLFTGINFDEMIRIIREDCDFRWIAFAMVISIFSHVFRALRWRIQLDALGIRVPLFPLVLSIFGTYAVNLVFPRLGEVWRSGYIANRQHAPFTTVFGSMVADRLADTLTVLILALAAFALASGTLISFLEANGESYAAIGRLLVSPWLWGAVILCVGALWWFMTRKYTSGPMLKLQTALRELWQGFAVIVTMPGKGRWLLWTVALWGCYFVQNYITFYAFPFTREVLADHGVIAAFVTFVISSLSMGVPSNGGIGPWQWAVIFALGIYGVAATQAGAYANLVLGSQTLLLIALGIFTFAAIALDKKKAARGAAGSKSESTK